MYFPDNKFESPYNIYPVVDKKLQTGLLLTALIIFVITGIAFLSPVSNHTQNTTSIKAKPLTEGKVLFSQPVHEAMFSGSALVRSLPANHALSLEICNSSGYTYDKLMFSEPVFQLRKGDLNRDGSDEIFLGIIKKTKFDPVLKKRMFIFSVDSLCLRPFFLSSRLSSEPIDFGASRSTKNQIITIEKSGTSTFKIGVYSRLDFGFIFKGYKKTYNTLTECQRDFNHEIYQ